jgi:hypothetical protein
MRNLVYIIIAIFFVFGLAGCEEKWDEHYSDVPETINKSIWDALKADNETSEFAKLVEQFGLDSIFNHDDVHTFFVPSNEAIKQYTDTAEIKKSHIAYHILHQFIQPNNIEGKRKMQTLFLKFAQFEKSGDQYLYDGIPVSFTSPLYMNGRYFILDKVATPNPSLYEYISQNNSALKKFIDDQDSIILDKELSEPIGFDDDGNTIYDSVVTVLNRFEEEYFEVSEEMRVKTATLVFPTQGKYNQALTNMALDMGYNTYDDIPVGWQQDVLVPFLIEHGLFSNMIEENEFKGDSVKNILGDSVALRFEPVNKTICSNGYAYDYSEFEVLDSLYNSPLRTEGESLTDALGSDRYVWKDSVIVESDKTYRPLSLYVNGSSNDTIMRVQFDKGYEGIFNLEFKTQPLFPRKYLFVVRTNIDFGGEFDIYVNNELVRSFDYKEFMRFAGGQIMPSVVSGERYVAQGRFNKFDFWVDNIIEYGRANIRFEYKGPSDTKKNGIFIDYVGYYPEESLDLITKNP